MLDAGTGKASLEWILSLDSEKIDKIVAVTATQSMMKSTWQAVHEIEESYKVPDCENSPREVGCQPLIMKEKEG